MRRAQAYFSKRKRYAYHRRSRTRVRAPWGTPQFDEEHAAIEKRTRRRIAPDDAPALCRALFQFQSSEHFQAYSLRQRTAFQNVADWLSVRCRDVSLGDLNAALTRKLRDRAKKDRGYRFANATLDLLQAFAIWAHQSGMLHVNATTGVGRLPRPRTEAASTARRTIEPIRANDHPLTDSTKKKKSGV